MAKDDMALIAFKVLSSLYECMTKGNRANPDFFKAESGYFGDGLKQSYLNAICRNLEDRGYTKGFSFVQTWGGDSVMTSCDAVVTLDGFEYMKENASMRKAYNYLKEAKGWVPFF